MVTVLLPFICVLERPGPETVQLLVSVESQLMVEEPGGFTRSGLALMETAGWLTVMFTFAVLGALFGPMHVRLYEVGLTVSGPVETGEPPVVEKPGEVQEVPGVEVQKRFVGWPLFTVHEEAEVARFLPQVKEMTVGGFCSEQEAVAPPFRPAHCQDQEEAPLTAFALVPAVQA